MLFDWFTVLAQIGNFLILMWLLKKFLYKPVLNAIDTREKRIADLLKETEQDRLQVEQQQSELIAKNEEFALERQGLLAQANTEAADIKQYLLATASNDAAQQRSQWILALQTEQKDIDQNIIQRAKREVFQVARKTLQDLSSVELETQISQIFIKQLEQLSAAQKQQFTSSPTNSLVVRSAMALNDDNRNSLQQSIASVFSTQLTLHFEVDATLISGIELVGEGHKLSWNIDNYLKNLEDRISGVIGSKVAQNNRQTSGKGELNASGR